MPVLWFISVTAGWVFNYFLPMAACMEFSSSMEVKNAEKSLSGQTISSQPSIISYVGGVYNSAHGELVRVSSLLQCGSLTL